MAGLLFRLNSDLGVVQTELGGIIDRLGNFKVRIYKEKMNFQNGKSTIGSAAPNTFSSTVVCCASVEDTSLGLIVTAAEYNLKSFSIALDCRKVSTGELYTGLVNIQIVMIGL